jgi:murein DD-endopeptidase MepM/ murein hydrolase activator NlpD
VFGYRSDPFTHQSRFHAGNDFACDVGNTVYATGDGVVESVREEFSGYGLSVLVDHGFGYKTRYAHMSRIDVTAGMKVRRGMPLGLSGNTGRSTGPHVHYEVIYKGDPVDPGNYYDPEIPVTDYVDLIQNASGGPQS